MNYPSPDVAFTRVVEYKHVPNQSEAVKVLAIPPSSPRPCFTVPLVTLILPACRRSDASGRRAR